MIAPMAPPAGEDFDIPGLLKSAHDLLRAPLSEAGLARNRGHTRPAHATVIGEV